PANVASTPCWRRCGTEWSRAMAVEAARETARNSGAAAPAGLRIDLVVSSLRMGGAERVAAFLATSLAEANTVRVLTYAPAGETPFHAPDPRVRVVNLGLRE